MEKQKLLEDLINDFQEQKKNLKAKIDLLDPIATSIRMPAATRLLNKSLLIITEIFVWILILGSIALVIFMDTIYPFQVWWDLSSNSNIPETVSNNDLQNFSWMIKGVIIFLILLLLWISRMLVKIRHKNDVLQLAGKNMKNLVEQYFERRTTMEDLENKYPFDLPKYEEGVFIIEPELKDESDPLIIKGKESNNPDQPKGHNDIIL